MAAREESFQSRTNDVFWIDDMFGMQMGVVAVPPSNGDRAPPLNVQSHTPYG